MSMAPDFWQFGYGDSRRARARPRQERALALVTRAARIERWAREDEGAPRQALPRCSGHPAAVARASVPYGLLAAASVAAEIAAASQGLPRIPVNWFRGEGAFAKYFGFMCPCSPMIVHIRADHPGDVAESVFHEIRHVAQHREHGQAADEGERERREEEALRYGKTMARQLRELGAARSLRRAVGDIR